jgi:tetratricopeptide (TPR) repeat protein
MSEESYLPEEFNHVLQRFEQMMRDNASYYFDREELEDLIYYYSDQFLFSKALLVVEHAKNLFPQNAALQIREAEIYTSMGQLHKALGILKKTSPFEEEQLDWLMANAVAYSQLHEHDKAIGFLEQAIQTADVESYDDIALELALEYQNANKTDKAISLLKHVILRRPESETLLYEMAFCYETSGKLAEALEFFTSLSDDRPMSFPTWYCLGNIQQQLELLSESVDSYDFSLALMPDFVPAIINKAQAQFKLKEYKTAIDTLQSSFHLEPPDATTHCHLGECYEKLEEVVLAQEHYVKAIELDERCADAYLGLAVVLDYQNKSLEALKFAEIAFRFDNQNEEYLTVLVKLLAKTDQIDAAVSKANDLILLKPHDDESWVVMADIYYQQDLIESGLQYLEQGLQLIPDSTMIAYRKLVYLYGLKKFNEAEDWLETIFDSTQTEDLMEIETLDPTLCDWMPYALKRKNN